jgi:hypothetical protein
VTSRADYAGMAFAVTTAARAARTARASLAGEERVRAFLRAHAPAARASISISASGRRDLHRTAELLRSLATAHGCRVALAETGHIAAHWIDGIVWGTARDLEAFLAEAGPALRAEGRRARHEVGAIVAA